MHDVPGTVTALDTLLRSLEPARHDGVYVFAVAPADADLAALSPVATMREDEGLTVVLPEADAIRAGLPVLFRAAWITLRVQSDLAAVGLTAAFATALGEAGLSCNVIAGAYHDHIFVPVDRADEALGVLRALQASARDGQASRPADAVPIPVPVPVDVVRPLRHSILRPAQPPEACHYPGDDKACTLHLAVRRGGRVVAVGSMFEEDGAWRLRGMATEPASRGRGLGGLIVEAFAAEVARRGGGRLWCNARVDAAGFYRRHGFADEGDVFDLPPIGPHVRLARVVTPAR
ncbi:MAG: GNAT family N-acetyltransferase [Vicinamibacterales bacterium]|nr:GNAT family N-acetyltransferase [Vicinamibacterales bacterium]